ncbi:LicD family protein [Butyrivibrio sp. AE3004]|uniref:LicD family protein n=1 Tax=Butyrivibrio sp. AE3004 TaxID=1506994 RepID=UPI00049407E7|nr:LicD family protein [Butyrivibrio sp. AE3004]
MGYELKHVQNRLVEMAIIIEDIFNRNNVPHSIINGTLLGAVRHGGFIPWDDDFDFCVFNEYYDVALTCLRRELPDWLFLEDEKSEPRYFHAWAHVKDLKTIARCDHYIQDNYYSHHGLSIDLYRLEKVVLGEQYCRKEDEFFKYIVRRQALGLLDYKEMQKKLEQLKWCTQMFFEFDLMKESLSSINRAVYADLYITNRCFEIDDLFPLKKIKFENTEFFGPNDPDAVLTKSFGEYMTLPPEEERILHYSNVEFLE